MNLTESINKQSRDIDLKPLPEILKIINAEDKKASAAVAKALPQIARAVRLIVKKLGSGGRLFYVGAGTSGRLGMLDAAECPPTYGVPPTTVQAIMAGGQRAFLQAAESDEDDVASGMAEIKKRGINARDVVVGLSASGNTPFVRSALVAARKAGAATIAIICNARGTITDCADVIIRLLTGPEVIAGSTRMKAASAQKMALNMLSTAAMIKLGKVTGNFMTDMRPTNSKLKKRAAFIVQNVCGVDQVTAVKFLEKSDYNIRKAIHGLRK
jgi:N-acetylmuramic acid 6-phosphate etherase